MSFLDPRVWLAVLLTAFLSSGIAYFKGRADARVACEREASEAASQARAREQAWSNAVEGIGQALNEEKARAAKVERDLRARIRSGDVRLSVPAYPAPGASAPAAGEHQQARTDLDPGTAEALVALTERGDQAIRELNACIDAYNSLRK